MAINPPSDIVLDVARAVDPAQYRAAVEKLGKTGQAAPIQAEAFTSLLGVEDAPAAPPSPKAPADPALADLRGRLPDTDFPSAGKALEPLQRFEAFVLQSFVQSMLPKDAESVFGEGLAGDIWSSLLAEQIAAQMAEAGGIGIADGIAAAHPTLASAAAAPGSAAPDRFRREAPGDRLSVPASPAGFVASMELGFADAVRPGRTDAHGAVGGAG